MSARSLNARMRAFADAWNGAGSVLGAMRVAGYAGTERTLYPAATKLLKDERVRARIEARLPGALAAYEAGPPDAPPPIAREQDAGLVEGKGRGTTTERAKIGMSIARSKKTDARDRIAALRYVSELEGELRVARPVRGRGAAVVGASPVPSTPAPAPKRGLHLVTNERDKELVGAS